MLRTARDLALYTVFKHYAMNELISHYETSDKHFYPECLFFISFHHPSIIQFERENEKEGQHLFEYLLTMDYSFLNSHLKEPFNNGRFFLLLVQFSGIFFPVSFLLVLTSRFL